MGLGMDNRCVNRVVNGAAVGGALGASIGTGQSRIAQIVQIRASGFPNLVAGQKCSLLLQYI